jgi:Mg-chelatase subunit ChlD
MVGSTYGFLAICVLCGCSAEIQGTNYAGYTFQEAEAGSANNYPGGAGGSYSGGTDISATSNGGTRGTTQVTQSAGVDKTCAAVSNEAKQVEVQVEVQIKEVAPVALFFMLDQSASMQNGVKFPAAENAVTWLVNDPSSVNLDVALQYFPLLGGACDTGAGYAVPEVPLTRLPGCSSAIASSLAMHAIPGVGLGIGTPTEGALRGATSFCAKFKADTVANPDREDCAVVLMTDGQPNACMVNDGPGLAKIAKNAYDTSQVMTFTVGMTGADFTVLNQISQAGHTDCTPSDPTSYACDVTSGGNSFIDALALIRGTVTKTMTKTELQTKALECEWNIPQPANGDKLDPMKVNVQFSPTGTDKDTTIIAMVASSDKCGTEQGWHYDNAVKPTRIVACKSTCDTIKAAPKGKINIMLGCETVVVIS